MLIFLVLSFGYLVGWGAMFVSPTFRWTFVLWTFFVRPFVPFVLLRFIVSDPSVESQIRNVDPTHKAVRQVSSWNALEREVGRSGPGLD